MKSNDSWSLYLCLMAVSDWLSFIEFQCLFVFWAAGHLNFPEGENETLTSTVLCHGGEKCNRKQVRLNNRPQFVFGLTQTKSALNFSLLFGKTAVRWPQQHDKCHALVQNSSADKCCDRMWAIRLTVSLFYCDRKLPRHCLELVITLSVRYDVMCFHRRCVQTDGPRRALTSRQWLAMIPHTMLAWQQRSLPQCYNLRFSPTSCYWAA